MGEISEMIMDGTLCQDCGDLMLLEGQRPPGHPQSCGCVEDEEPSVEVREHIHFMKYCFCTKCGKHSDELLADSSSRNTLLVVPDNCLECLLHGDTEGSPYDEFCVLDPQDVERSIIPLETGIPENCPLRGLAQVRICLPEMSEQGTRFGFPTIELPGGWFIGCNDERGDEWALHYKDSGTVAYGNPTYPYIQFMTGVNAQTIPPAYLQVLQLKVQEENARRR
jgi:hypothetical protein